MKYFFRMKYISEFNISFLKEFTNKFFDKFIKFCIIKVVIFIQKYITKNKILIYLIIQEILSNKNIKQLIFIKYPFFIIDKI